MDNSRRNSDTKPLKFKDRDSHCGGFWAMLSERLCWVMAELIRCGFLSSSLKNGWIGFCFFRRPSKLHRDHLITPLFAQKFHLPIYPSLLNRRDFLYLLILRLAAQARSAGSLWLKTLERLKWLSRSLKSWTSPDKPSESLILTTFLMWERDMSLTCFKHRTEDGARPACTFGLLKLLLFTPRRLFAILKQIE